MLGTPMLGTHAGFSAQHWGLALGAAALGVALALAYLLCDYLIVPALRLRMARRRGPGAVGAFVEGEMRRLRRLENTAAVYGEHGHPDAAALREEAELWAVAASLTRATRFVARLWASSARSSSSSGAPSPGTSPSRPSAFLLAFHNLSSASSSSSKASETRSCIGKLRKPGFRGSVR